MSEDRELGRRVRRLTAVLGGLLAGACGLWWGAAEGVGVLVGSLVMLLNFAGLEWATGRVVRGVSRGSASGLRPALWLGASGARLGLVALVVGAAVAGGWVGLGGLLVSLMVVPVTVVMAGLLMARAA